MQSVMQRLYLRFTRVHPLCWLLLIVCVAAVLRFSALGAHVLVADEYLDANATYGYAQTGQWHAWDWNHEAPSTRINPASDQRAWLYRIQVAWLYAALPPTEAVMRIVSVLWGLVTTVLLYFVARSWRFSTRGALFAAALFALSVPAIEQNRFLRMYSMFAPVFLALSWSVFVFLERGTWQKHARNLLAVRWSFAPLVLALGAVAYHLHQLAASIVFVTLAYLITMAFVNRAYPLRAQHYWLYLLSLLGIFFAGSVLAPQLFAQFKAGLVFFENHYSYIGHISRNVAHPLLGWGLLLLGAWALVARAGSSDARRSGIWLTLSFFVPLTMAIFIWARVVGPQYIFFLQPFALLLIAAGADHALRFVEGLAPKRLVHSITVAGTALVLLLVPQYGYFFEENTTYHQNSRSTTPNYRTVFDYLRRNVLPDDVLVTRNFRNYYYNKMGMTTFDFGSERGSEVLAAEGKLQKVTAADVERILATHASGWVVLSDNDERFVTKEARAYLDTHAVRLNEIALRGPITVWRWGGEE